MQTRACRAWHPPRNALRDRSHKKAVATQPCETFHDDAKSDSRLQSAPKHSHVSSWAERGQAGVGEYLENAPSKLGVDVDLLRLDPTVAEGDAWRQYGIEKYLDWRNTIGLQVCRY
jgi:hypothetical protein